MKVGSTVYDSADAPGATLPDGRVLVEASPGTFSTPSHFWEWSISRKGRVSATQVNDTKQAANTSLLRRQPDGSPDRAGHMDNSQVTPNEVAIYTPKGSPKAAWLPVVSSVSATLKVGSTKNAFSARTSTASIWVGPTVTMRNNSPTGRWCASPTPRQATSVSDAATGSRLWASGPRALRMRSLTFPRPARRAQARFRLS